MDHNRVFRTEPPFSTYKPLALGSIHVAPKLLANHDRIPSVYLGRRSPLTSGMLASPTAAATATGRMIEDGAATDVR
jgi:hypothetical protein